MGPSVSTYYCMVMSESQYCRGHKRVLYDRPPRHFHRASDQEMHEAGTSFCYIVHALTPSHSSSKNYVRPYALILRCLIFYHNLHLLTQHRLHTLPPKSLQLYFPKQTLVFL